MPESRPECPVCGHDESTPDDDATSIVSPSEPFCVVKCSSCSMRWLGVAPSEEVSERAMYRHDSLSALAHELPGGAHGSSVRSRDAGGSVRSSVREDRPDAAAYDARMLDTLSGAATGGRRLLEIGCGRGEFLIAARDRGWDVAGLEDCAVAAAAAREEHGLDVAHGTLELLGNLDATHEYHAVYLDHVFEHLSDLHGSIEVLRGQLAPGGALLIVVPNRFEAWSHRVRGRPRPSPGGTSAADTIEPTHFFGPRQLCALLEQHALSVELATHQPDEFGSSLRGQALRWIDRLGDRVASQGRTIEALARPV